MSYAFGGIIGKRYLYRTFMLGRLLVMEFVHNG